VTPTIFGSTVGYPSDSLASCLVLDSDHAECLQKLGTSSFIVFLVSHNCYSDVVRNVDITSRVRFST